MYNEDDYIAYKVLDENEIEEAMGLIKDGTYAFEVIKAIKKVTGENAKEPGQPMIELQIKVWDNEGKEFLMRDWLLFSGKNFMRLKLFWESVGHPELCNGRISPSMCLGQSGFLKTKVGKDKNGNPQAKIMDYVVVKTEKPTKNNDDLDDDITF
jgi:hypothetical protein